MCANTWNQGKTRPTHGKTTANLPKKQKHITQPGPFLSIFLEWIMENLKLTTPERCLASWHKLAVYRLLEGFCNMMKLGCLRASMVQWFWGVITITNKKYLKEKKLLTSVYKRSYSNHSYNIFNITKELEKKSASFPDLPASEVYAH